VDAAGPGAAGGSTPELIERAVEEGRLDRATADLHLASALAGESVPAAYRGSEPWDGTPVLLELEERLGEMRSGPERRALRTSLHPGPGGAGTDFCGGVGGSASTTESLYFYIEYSTIGGGLDIEDYKDSLDRAWEAEVRRFGWAAPPRAPVPAPSGKYSVVVAATEPTLYGFTASSGSHAGRVGDNPNTSWNDGDSHASCIVLNEDYSALAAFQGVTTRQALDATTAHEFNHAVQYGYGALHGENRPDPVFYEGGATWMEDEVFDDANDNYNYLWPNLGDDMGHHEGSPYRYWIVFRAMTERYGTGVGGGAERIMQRFWEITSRNQGDTLEALEKALQPEGTPLARAFHQAAVAIRFARACGGGYRQPYCFEEGAGYTAARGTPAPHATIGGVGSSLSGSMPDNYSANFVDMPGDIGTVQVVLANTSPKAGRFTGSIVCDTGAGLRVTPFSGTATGGERVYARTVDTNGCAAASIVVVNVSKTGANPPSSTDRPYTLQVTPPPAPSKTKVRGRARPNAVKVRGRVRPPQPGSEVTLKLFRKVNKKVNKRWKRSDTDVVALKGGKRFRAKMRRPNVSRCRVVAIFPGDADHLPSKARRAFRC
jgi:hypothetical protein